ncbi:hypothetical protein [Halodesulfovibrio spirochaetisodalis]|uniref:Uncharacterized protein n=1 Tax=Halodesulfovibrio spirochaetisodalis TaxID=1560234 RepID=A0A1B7X9M9_9BACT|nr:hypothetical protein [Halodesulfovibrio spirochaetisodalis]OBQ46071.1 hypothetical protein SP90_14330 [Halodesulfovibrio spirochaetisodalis]
MAQSITIPTGMLPSMDELRDAAATLQQIRKDTSATENSIALDYLADKLIEFAGRIDNGVARRVAA